MSTTSESPRAGEWWSLSMLAGDGGRRVVRREAVARAGGAQGLQDFFVRVDHWALLGGVTLWRASPVPALGRRTASGRRGLAWRRPRRAGSPPAPARAGPSASRPGRSAGRTGR